MASVEAMPAYLHPGVPVVQPPHLEGDASLATEILPGPPSLLSVQQTGLPRKDHKKTIIHYSYLHPQDPGTTYSALLALQPVAEADMDGSRRKRARVDKRCVVRDSRATVNDAEPIVILLLSDHHHGRTLSRLCNLSAATK